MKTKIIDFVTEYLMFLPAKLLDLTKNKIIRWIIIIPIILLSCITYIIFMIPWLLILFGTIIYNLVNDIK